MRVRRFKRDVCNHVYQRTIDRFNIFYDAIDYLVYFTIFSVCASKYKVTVLGLCLMIDHIHTLVTASCKNVLSNFISNVTSVFVREYNYSLTRKGPLFEKRFGSAPKMDKKRLMSAIIYLGNNPVEKQVCSRAEQYQWNFLAYMKSDNPFSAPISEKISEDLKRALGVVDWYHASGKYLNHTLLWNLWKKLSEHEARQLADYIVVKYNVIDYSELKSYFGSYEQMVLSMHSTTGSEYDLKEHVDRFSDATYREMIKCVTPSMAGICRRVILLPTSSKYELLMHLHASTGASPTQLRKFLHLKENPRELGHH